MQGKAEEKIWYRFKPDYSSSWYVNEGAWDAIDFKVSSSVEFVGYVSFGPMQKNDFGVTYKYAVNGTFVSEEKQEFLASDL